ncbi:MAG: glycosyltransferase [bacterium]|nr:glycosyltransferase [bacterium]
MNDAPLVSAVLVSWNRLDYLKKAIDSLRRAEGVRLEIIVADNGSSDGSLEWLRKQPDVALIENKRNAGACRARNQGTRAARGEFVLYMDSDAELVTPGGPARLIETLRGDDALAGAGGVIYGDDALTQVWCVSPTTDWEGNYDPAASVAMTDDPHILSTCFCLFKTAAVRETGGFDEFYFYLFEDGDLCQRMRKRGYRFVIDPEVKIVHHYATPGRTARGQVDYHYYHERIRMYYLLKNWGLAMFLASWRLKIADTLRYRPRFPYLPLWRYIDIYYLRAALMFFAFPLIRLRRSKKWI